MMMRDSWLSRLRLLLGRLGDLPVFDTARWPAREWGPRLIAIALVTWGLYGRVTRLPAQLKGARLKTARMIAEGYPELAARTVELLSILAAVLVIAIFIAYIVAWATRTSAVASARGFTEVVLPLLIAALSFGLSGPPTLAQWLAPQGTPFILMVVAVNLLMAGGFALILVAVLNLRTSFSLMAEARPLVCRGLYRWVRHPIYTGNFVMLLGVLLLQLAPRAVVIYLAVVVGHVYRARLEERKLTATYPEYEAYRRRTGMFLPVPGRLFALSAARLAADPPRGSS